MQSESESTDDFEGYKPSFLKEKSLIISIVSEVSSDNTANFDNDFGNLTKILLVYQEQSYLLNPFMNDILQPLNSGLKDIVHDGTVSLV